MSGPDDVSPHGVNQWLKANPGNRATFFNDRIAAKHEKEDVYRFGTLERSYSAVYDAHQMILTFYERTPNHSVHSTYTYYLPLLNASMLAVEIQRLLGNDQDTVIVGDPPLPSIEVKWGQEMIGALLTGDDETVNELIAGFAAQHGVPGVVDKEGKSTFDAAQMVLPFVIVKGELHQRVRWNAPPMRGITTKPARYSRKIEESGTGGQKSMRGAGVENR